MLRARGVGEIASGLSTGDRTDDKRPSALKRGVVELHVEYHHCFVPQVILNNAKK